MQKAALMLAAVLTVFVLYSPQPLLPVFAEIYGITEWKAASIITMSLIPLAIAPLLYGYLLEVIAPMRLLPIALSFMGLSCVFLPFVPDANYLLGLRLIQGLMLPAVFTSVTTHLSQTTTPSSLQPTMSLYISSTIFGGFMGRLLSGIFAEHLHWHYFYYMLAGLLILLAAYLFTQHPSASVKYKRPDLSTIGLVFKNSNVLRIYLAIFCIFFSFAAILNYLPFHIKRLSPDAGTQLTGLVYSGYVVGIFTSMSASRLIKRVGLPARLMFIAGCVYLLAVGLMAVETLWIAFLALCLCCGSMFMAHSVAVAEVNRQSKQPRGLVNAIYITSYYTGGVLGSYLPGWIYQNLGWQSLLMAVFVMASLGLVAIGGLLKWN